MFSLMKKSIFLVTKDERGENGEVPLLMIMGIYENFSTLRFIVCLM